MAENISVCVRVRPLNDKEKEHGLGWKVDHAGTNISEVAVADHNQSSSSLSSSSCSALGGAAQGSDVVSLAGGEHKYAFDRIYDETWGTKHIYEDVCVPVVDSVVEGFNGTIFAYGQTSSGKTYTMRGSATWESGSAKPAPSATGEENQQSEGGEELGILPLAVRGIFKRIQAASGREFLLRISYMEIYNEDIIDLLAQCNGKDAKTTGQADRRRLLVKERANGGGPYVCGLREEIVRSEDEVAAWLKKGDIHRHVGETKMNRNSSRSHTLFQMVIESRASAGADGSSEDDDAILVSKLTLVDLAGSERLSKTCAEGKRAKEGAYINKSLLTLGTVINKLSEGQHKHIPYRDSKLTRILQTALGGNSKTAMITNITPSVFHMDETHSTLRFATRTKSVKNAAVVNEVLNDDALLKRQQKEIERLRDRLKEKNNGVDIEATEAAIKDMKDHLIEVKEQNKSIEEMLVQERNEKDVMRTDLQHKSRKLENLTTFILNEADANSLGSGRSRRSKRDRMSWCPSSMHHPATSLPAVEEEAAQEATRRASDDLQITLRKSGVEEEREATSEVKLLQEALVKLRKDVTQSRQEVASRDEMLREISLRAESLQSSLGESQTNAARLEQDLSDTRSEFESYKTDAESLLDSVKQAKEETVRELQEYKETATQNIDAVKMEVTAMGESLEKGQEMLSEERKALGLMREAREEAEESLRAKQDAIEDLEGQLKEAIGAAKAGAEKVAALEGSHKELNETLAEMESSKSNLEACLKEREVKEVDLGEQLAALAEDNAFKEGEIQRLKLEIEGLVSEQEERDALVKKLENDKLDSVGLLREMDVLKSDLQKSVKEQEDARACAKDLEAKIAAGASEAQDLRSRAADMAAELETARKELTKEESLREAYEEKSSKLEGLLNESEVRLTSEQSESKKMEGRLRSLTERLNSAVGSQSKLSEDLRVSREDKIAASRRERKMEERMEEAEEKLHEKDQLACDLEVKLSTLQAELATSKQKHNEIKAKASQVKAELMAENTALKDKAEALERKIVKLEVMKGDPEDIKDQRKMLATLQKELSQAASESRYWKQQTKELTAAQVKHGSSVERIAKLERDKKDLSVALEKAEERSDELSLQVANLNAQVSSTNSKIEQCKHVDFTKLGEECSKLESKQLVVIESQGGIGRMIDSFLQNRRRMAKLQAVYNDMKSKVGKLEGGEDVFGRLKSVSELEYDLHYMANKKKSFESKYNDLKKQIMETKRPASIVGKENLCA